MRAAGAVVSQELLADFAGAVGRMEAEALRSLRAAAEGACGGALRAVVPEPALLAEMEEEQEAALQETLGGLREAARTKQAELLSELLKASLTASLLKQLARLLDRPPGGGASAVLPGLTTAPHRPPWTI